MASNPITQPKSKPRLGVNSANINRSRNVPEPSTSRQTSTGDDISGGVLASLKCPGCSRVMELPIYICKSGHSLCHFCVVGSNNRCPVCCNEVTTQRNYTLEDIASKVKKEIDVDCTYKQHGCLFRGNRSNVAKHELSCQFQPYICPMWKFDNSCEWKGNISNLLDHFRRTHSQYSILEEGKAVIFKNIDVSKHDRNIQLFIYQHFMFLYHVRINPNTETACWAIQCLGSEDVAKSWQYEIHIYLPEDISKKIVFSENCISYNTNVDEVFNSCKCATIPLKVMKNFCNSSSDFTFKFYVKPKSYKKSALPASMVQPPRTLRGIDIFD